MKLFLDIGAHDGETLSIAQQQKWGFDRIVRFEPAPACWPKVEAFADPRVELCRFGLWDKADQVVLNNPGKIGASMWASKDPVDTSVFGFRAKPTQSSRSSKRRRTRSWW